MQGVKQCGGSHVRTMAAPDHGRVWHKGRMERFATVYVSDGREALPAIRTLLAINGIQCIEIDISNDRAAGERIAGTTGPIACPVVELDGVCAAGGDILALARALKLKVTGSAPGLSGACC